MEVEVVKLDSGCSGASRLLTGALAFSQGNVPFSLSPAHLYHWTGELNWWGKKMELILLLFPVISLFGSGEHWCWLVTRTSCSFSLAVAGVTRLQVPRMAGKVLCPVLLAASMDHSGGRSYSVGFGGWSSFREGNLPHIEEGGRSSEGFLKSRWYAQCREIGILVQKDAQLQALLAGWF